MPEMLRTFVALPLSDEVEQALAQVQRALKRTCPNSVVKWVHPASIHLTLFFLGEILPKMVDPVQTALSVVARNVPPFAFEVERVGAFPNLNRPRVVWAGVEDASGKLALLHQAVNEALEKVGFQPDKRRFSPHLTLGRLRRRVAREDARSVGQAVEKLGTGDLGTVSAQEIIFFRSVLKPTGAEYTPLATFPLGKR